MHVSAVPFACFLMALSCILSVTLDVLSIYNQQISILALQLRPYWWAGGSSQRIVSGPQFSPVSHVGPRRHPYEDDVSPLGVEMSDVRLGEDTHSDEEKGISNGDKEGAVHSPLSRSELDGSGERSSGIGRSGSRAGWNDAERDEGEEGQVAPGSRKVRDRADHSSSFHTGHSVQIDYKSCRRFLSLAVPGYVSAYGFAPPLCPALIACL